MRAYTVATAAVALGVSAKLIDNLLSHHQVAGVRQSRQGVSRRLSPEAVATLELALRLTRGFAVPMRKSLVLAGEMLGGELGTGELRPVNGITILVNLAAIRAETNARLAEAVEIAPVPRRGRPARGD